MYQFREWLSIQFINLGVALCPYPEMRYYLIGCINDYLSKR